jgi:hypothetical protein
VLEDRFGKDVEIRPVRASSGWGLRRLFGPSAGIGGLDIALEGLTDDLIAAAERRALWQRFGL